MELLTIIGRVGKEPVLKGDSGREFYSFTVAVNQNFTKTDGTKVERTNWYSCILRNTNSKVVQYLKPGTQVCIVGQPAYNVYQDNERQWKVGLSLAAEKIQLLGSKKETENPQANPAPTGNDFNPSDDDLPF